jgi:hypothetical protein
MFPAIAQAVRDYLPIPVVEADYLRYSRDMATSASRIDGYQHYALPLQKRMVIWFKVRSISLSSRNSYSRVLCLWSPF